MTGIRSWGVASLAVLTLASCGPNGFQLDQLDPDFRNLGGLNTASAAAAAQPRPQPDARGIISYPGYQVAIARQGDSVTSIASRLGLNAQQLAQYNAINPTAVLNAGAVIALPTRVATGVVQPGGQVTVPPIGDMAQPGTASAGEVTSTTLGAAPTKTTTAANTTAPQPRQHVVASGETAWSIARKYGVSANDLAKWNGLSGEMSLRIGQRLLIPVAGAAAPAVGGVTAPGAGSPTPVPPSSTEPLPKEKTVPASTPVAAPNAPDMGKQRTAASGGGRFAMPVNGAIARTYQKGKNEGIDISAAPGSAVSAAGAGTVAAITKDVDGVPIVVVRHDGNLMTVYAGIDNVTVSKGEKVSAGTAIGKARQQGIVHFEVRNGFESVDPEKYLR